MITKSQRQFIRKLQQKKYRSELNCFLVEGKKSISEFLNSSFELEMIFCTEILWENVPTSKITKISFKELQSISLLKNPDEGVAIFKIPESKPQISNLIIALDNLQDPGNLGTIIRLCDWFGIKQIVCSNETVDCYNPKVIQATMGSLSRVSVMYLDLHEFLKTTDLPIFATTLKGDNVYQKSFPEKAILVMGNEANGISESILSLCNQRLTIPKFGESVTESLNVAIASAILISEFVSSKIRR